VWSLISFGGDFKQITYCFNPILDKWLTLKRGLNPSFFAFKKIVCSKYNKFLIFKTILI